MSDPKDPHDDLPEETAAPAAPPAADETEGGKDATSERSQRPAGTGRRKVRRGSARVEQQPAPSRTSFAVGVAVVAALAGAAGGWFGHDAQAKAKLRADSAPAASGSAAPSGPCGTWQQKICAGSGETSSACSQAKSATDLLTPSTCEAALLAVPATLAKVKAARASCDSLVAKLCADLAPGSQTCSMVRERTPSFPPQRCDGMLEHYTEVIAELRQMDQQGGAQMGAGQAPHPMGAPMGAPHGAPMGAPMGAGQAPHPMGAPMGTPHGAPGAAP